MNPTRIVRRTTCAALALLAAACVPGLRANSGTELRVMTYNIHSGHGNLERTVDVIRASAADIVVVQEVDVHWHERSGFTDQVSLLSERLGMAARFAPIYDIPGSAAGVPRRQFGIAVLSRHPIVRWQNALMTRLSTQDVGARPVPMPGVADVTVDVRGTAVRVLGVHLDYRADPQVRRLQVTELLAYLSSSPEPTLLLGDLNATPDAAELMPLFARLRDVWLQGSGPGYTYPDSAPAKRIDYVLASPHFRVRAASVLSTPASDHLPVVVDLFIDRLGAH